MSHLNEAIRKPERVFTKYSKTTQRRSQRANARKATVRGLLKRLTDMGMKA